MLGTILSPVVGVIVTTSTGVAIEGLVKLITPVGLKAVPSFAVKIGGALVSAVVAGKVAEIAVDAIESVIETVRSTPESEPTDLEGPVEETASE